MDACLRPEQNVTGRGSGPAVRELKASPAARWKRPPAQEPPPLLLLLPPARCLPPAAAAAHSRKMTTPLPPAFIRSAPGVSPSSLVGRTRTKTLTRSAPSPQGGWEERVATSFAQPPARPPLRARSLTQPPAPGAGPPVVIPFSARRTPPSALSLALVQRLLLGESPMPSPSRDGCLLPGPNPLEGLALRVEAPLNDWRC